MGRAQGSPPGAALLHHAWGHRRRAWLATVRGNFVRSRWSGGVTFCQALACTLALPRSLQRSAADHWAHAIHPAGIGTVSPTSDHCWIRCNSSRPVLMIFLRGLGGDDSSSVVHPALQMPRDVAVATFDLGCRFRIFVYPPASSLSSLILFPGASSFGASSSTIWCYFYFVLGSIFLFLDVHSSSWTTWNLPRITDFLMNYPVLDLKVSNSLSSNNSFESCFNCAEEWLNFSYHGQPWRFVNGWFLITFLRT